MEPLDDLGEWNWRNCRQIGLKIDFWPLTWWPWFRVFRNADRFGGETTLQLGPLDLTLAYNVGTQGAIDADPA